MAHMAKKPRGSETIGDMVRSLAVLLIPVLAFLAWYTVTPDDPVEAIDWRAALAQARSEAPYPVLAPEGLPEGEGFWIPTRARWASAEQVVADDVGGNHWMVGFLDPSEIYIALHQTDAPHIPTVQKLSREGVTDGERDINGQTWQQRVSEDDRTRTLVLEEDGLTTLVVGDTGYDQLAAFAGTLEANEAQ